MGRGRLRKVSVSGAGEAVLAALELLRAGVLKGVLSHMHPEPVNYINAPVIASELGLAVEESREPDPGAYPSLLRVRYETDGEVHEAAGTVFGIRGFRLVYLDGFSFEINPEGSLLVYSNVDRPGMLAQVGALLASHGVNIAGLSLGTDRGRCACPDGDEHRRNPIAPGTGRTRAFAGGFRGPVGLARLSSAPPPPGGGGGRFWWVGLDKDYMCTYLATS